MLTQCLTTKTHLRKERLHLRSELRAAVKCGFARAVFASERATGGCAAAARGNDAKMSCPVGKQISDLDVFFMNENKQCA